MSRIKEARHYTIQLMELIDEGVISADDVVRMALSWMSEDDVEAMMRTNDLIEFVETI